MMSEEERAAALQMLGAGQARQAGGQLAGRQDALQAQEAAAMGAAPPPPAQTPYGGPVRPPPGTTEVQPSLMRRLADMLRGAGRQP